MNIQEAIKSGLNFRRKGGHWFHKDCAKHQPFCFDIAHILADDWEVEEQKITVTKQDVTKAYAEASKKDGQNIFVFRSNCSPPIIDNGFKLSTLLTELGFKDV